MTGIWPKAWSALAAVILAMPAMASPASQDDPQRGPAPVVETQRVTAFDLLVELIRPGKPERAVAPPADLAAGDFTVSWDGDPLPVVALATGPEDREPWRLVVYIDRVLSSNHTVRWAAMELAERADRLTGLGEVEIVVAEPEPRRALAPTRDGELVDQTLSGVFLAPAGAAELVARREEFLIEHPGASRGEAPAALARQAGRVERRLVRRQLDRLLEWLVESDPPTSRRAVLLAGDGWDLEPETFYLGGASAPPPESPHPDLGRATRELAETAAAYGWIVAPLAPPPPPVGVGRFGAFVLPDVTFPWFFAVKLRSLEVWLDGNRKPKRADALTELGHALRAQGKLDDAVEAYKKAVYRYYDHPKTARRQAAALVALGETLELQEETTAARTAFRTATVFDPTLASRFPFAAARLVEPRAPLDELAAGATGDVVTDPSALDRLLSSLGHRVRLTAQLAGLADGAIHKLGVRLHRAAFLTRSPRLARWGTPPATTRLRLRRLLDGEPTAGPLELTASAAAQTASGGLEVEAQLAPERATDPESAGGRVPLFLSWASAGPETAIAYHLRLEMVSTGDRAPPPTRLTVEPPAAHAWLAFLVEDPVGGAWGGALLETGAD